LNREKHFIKNTVRKIKGMHLALAMLKLLFWGGKQELYFGHLMPNLPEVYGGAALISGSFTFPNWEAKLLKPGFPKDLLPWPAQAWVNFIETPSAPAWYRAHNASIIDGYLKYADLANKETLPEKVFINMVLYRLLYAQSMVEGDFLFPNLGKILGNPQGSAVKFITSLDAYYPEHYPMTQKEINEVMGKTHSLEALGVELMDDVLIEPELTQLYHKASIWNHQPALNGLIKNHRPAYPYGEALPVPRQSWIIRILVWLRNIFLKK
jgi:hypothetical protein